MYTSSICTLLEYTQILQKVVFENENRFEKSEFGDGEYNMDKLNAYINKDEYICEEDLYENYHDEDNYEEYYPYEIFLADSGRYKFYDLTNYSHRLFIYWIYNTFISTSYIEAKVFNDDVEVINFLYNNLSINHISEFIKYSTFIKYIIVEPSHKIELKIEWLIFLCQVLEENPNISYADTKSAFVKYSLNFVENLVNIKNEIKIINDSRISYLWILWELEPGWVEYTNFAQWLPEELIVNISELEGKFDGRFSYSTYS